MADVFAGVWKPQTKKQKRYRTQFNNDIAAMASPSTLCFSWAHTLGGWSHSIRVQESVLQCTRLYTRAAHCHGYGSIKQMGQHSEGQTVYIGCEAGYQ